MLTLENTCKFFFFFFSGWLNHAENRNSNETIQHIITMRTNTRNHINSNIIIMKLIIMIAYDVGALWHFSKSFVLLIAWIFIIFEHEAPRRGLFRVQPRIQALNGHLQKNRMPETTHSYVSLLPEKQKSKTRKLKPTARTAALVANSGPST